MTEDDFFRIELNPEYEGIDFDDILDEETAKQLYDILKNQYISYEKYPAIIVLVRQLRQLLDNSNNDTTVMDR